MTKRFEGLRYFVMPICISESHSLSDTEKLTVGIIHSLSKGGYCYASREYLAQALGTTPNSIRLRLVSLYKKGVLNYEMVKDESGAYVQRRVSICQTSPLVSQLDHPRSDGQTIYNKDNNKDIYMSISKNPPSPPIPPTPPEWFDTFWDIYPRKQGKKRAREAWEKIKWTKDFANEVLVSLQKQKESEDWSRDNGQYIPHASTWLNGERWHDELKRKPRERTSLKFDD